MWSSPWKPGHLHAEAAQARQGGPHNPHPPQEGGRVRGVAEATREAHFFFGLVFFRENRQMHRIDFLMYPIRLKFSGGGGGWGGLARTCCTLGATIMQGEGTYACIKCGVDVFNYSCKVCEYAYDQCEYLPCRMHACTIPEPTGATQSKARMTSTCRAKAKQKKTQPRRVQDVCEIPCYMRSTCPTE